MQSDSTIVLRASVNDTQRTKTNSESANRPVKEFAKHDDTAAAPTTTSTDFPPPTMTTEDGSNSCTTFASASVSVQNAETITITNRSGQTGAPMSPFIPAPPLASSRYNRQLLIPTISLTGQECISRSKLLIIGLGGLGSPAALYLAGAGVHTLGLLDFDVVETSNLHRQIAHRESSVKNGLSKVASAVRACQELNSDIELRSHEVRLEGGNVCEIVHEYDVVLDCTDNPATRYLISDVCVALGKVLVSGAAQRLDGQSMVLNELMGSSGDVRSHIEDETHKMRGPCYRCVFPRPPPPEMVKGCSEIGIMGPVVGAIGTLMASEALRIIVQGTNNQRKKPSMLLYNAWPDDPRNMFRTVGLRSRRPDCLACGDEEVIKGKGLSKITLKEIKEGKFDYALFCGIVDDVHILPEHQRISPDEFLSQIGGHTDPSLSQEIYVIDVREPIEVELGPKIKDSINIPLTKIVYEESQAVTPGQGRSSIDQLLANERAQSFYFICQRGNDSQIAAEKMMKRAALEHGRDIRFIGDVKGGFLALEQSAGQAK